MVTSALIYKVLSGSASAVEKEEVEDWLNGNIGNTLEFNDLKQLFENSNPLLLVPSHNALDKIKKSVQSRFKAKVRKRIIILSFFILSLITLICSWLLSPKKEIPPGYLKFNNASITNVIDVLQDTYSISIEIISTDKDTFTFTGTLNRLDKPDHIMNILSRAMGLKLESSGSGRYFLVGQ